MFGLDDYDFELPSELIAQKPVEPRDASRLMVLHRERGTWEHRKFSDLAEYVGAGDVFVANDTRVLRARLLGKRVLDGEGAAGAQLGGKVEFLMLERTGPRSWEGALHASAKHKPGLRFRVPDGEGGFLEGEVVRGASESSSGTVEVRFDRDPLESRAGEVPLPPYIERPAEAGDIERYQTVYAREAGSAAAPTAGLHFTPALIDSLKERGASWETVTLNVGLGTFRPVKAEDIRQHVMHEERYSVDAGCAARLTAAKREGKRITAVGTTAVRTLETVWDGQAREFKEGSGRTSIFIHPGGRQVQAVDRLITNFHLPKSTLLMLVASLTGRELILEAYKAAVRERYRFFSYGDALLIC